MQITKTLKGYIKTPSNYSIYTHVVRHHEVHYDQVLVRNYLQYFSPFLFSEFFQDQSTNYNVDLPILERKKKAQRILSLDPPRLKQLNT